MLPYLDEDWGNPSSSYRFGSKLKTVLSLARDQTAALIGADSREIIFTSCATESNNTAIHAAIKANPFKRHIVTSKVEHSSVLSYCRALEQEGIEVTYLNVDRDGMLDLEYLESSLRPDTAVVSLMWANNETGVLFPIPQIAALCKSRGILFHCDAAQAAGKVAIDVKAGSIDYLSLAGHKFNAPKGIGALYVRRKAPFVPLIYGGYQEHSQRGGTENVALMVGMGKAAEMAFTKLSDYERTVRPLRDELERGILQTLNNAELNGHPIKRIANTANFTFHGIESEAILLLLDQESICASSGSACLADSDAPSHVISAMKPELGTARQNIRFSIGTENTLEQIEETIEALKRVIFALGS